MAVNVKDTVYEALKRRILTLDLEPGSHLDETTLSQEFGVSRTPLRDVLRQLAGEGYVQIRDNRGTIVSPMSHKTMRDFFMTAPMLYAAIARLAAQNARPAQIDELRAIQAQFRTAVETGDVEGMVEWNDRFHLALGIIADNQYLLPSYRRLLIDHARVGQTFWRARDRDAVQDIETAVAHHDTFIEVIAAGDEEAAVALTLQHWALSRDHMEMYVRPDPLPIDA